MTNLPTEANEADDAALIRRYVEQGDSDALGLLFQRHGEFAYRTALRVLRNPSEAEEAVQAAFVETMRKADRYRGGAGVRVWLMKIVINTCKRKIHRAVRRRKREEVYCENYVEGETQEAEAETLGKVKQALGQLPEKYRLPVWLHHYEGLPFREVAAMLSAREVTVRSHVSRGLDKLRQALAQAGVAVPSLALLDMLPNLPPDPAPAGFLQTLAALPAEGAGAATGGGSASGARVAARGLRTAPAGLKPLTLGALALAAVGLGGGLLYFVGQDDVRIVALEDEETTGRATDGIHLSWDFNTPEPPAGLTVVEGSWRHVAGAGPDGSGCMEITSPLFQLDVGGEDVAAHPGPIRVSYRVKPLPSEYEHSSTTFFIWFPYDNPALFNGLGRTLRYAPDARPWMTMTEFLSDGWVDGWMGEGREKRRQNLFRVRKREDSRLRLMIRGTHFLDNLEIRSVRPDEAPDLAVYVQALEAIPPEKRTGTVPLPHLKPGDPKGRVTVQF